MGPRYVLINGNYCFLKNIHTCDKYSKVFSIMSTYKYGKIMSKYSILNLCLGCCRIEEWFCGGIL